MIWVLYIALLLIYSCMRTPARIDFSYEDGIFQWQVSEDIIDACFRLNIILTFLVRLRMKISKLLIIAKLFSRITSVDSSYLILLSIFPFNLLFMQSNYN